MIGITIEHNEIVRWTSARGGKPVVRPAGEDTEVPAISFEDETRDMEVAWDYWLRTFDNGEFALLYEDSMKSGDLSRYWRIVPRYAEVVCG
jgi:hypothetical protein